MKKKSLKPAAKQFFALLFLDLNGISFFDSNQVEGFFICKRDSIEKDHHCLGFELSVKESDFHFEVFNGFFVASMNIYFGSFADFGEGVQEFDVEKHI